MLRVEIMDSVKMKRVAVMEWPEERKITSRIYRQITLEASAQLKKACWSVVDHECLNKLVSVRIFTADTLLPDFGFCFVQWAGAKEALVYLCGRRERDMRVIRSYGIR